MQDRNAHKANLLIFRPVNDFTIFTGFSCCSPDDEDKDLDDFIHNDAARHFEDKMAVTYAVYLLDDEFRGIPLAFFTLQNDALKIKASGYPYKTPPAVKIGRFGVRNDIQSNGIGSELLSMLKNFMCDNNRTGCRYITVDAYNNPRTVAFYKKNGFALFKEPNPQRPQELMYFDLARIPRGTDLK